MTRRTAACSCGQLRFASPAPGDPVNSICHCLACQKRTGSIFAVQARFATTQVTITGHSTCWTRRGDSGEGAIFHFCPVCGATVYWEFTALPGFVAVTVGAFADPASPPPHVSVYEERQHPWGLALGRLSLEHHF